MFARAPADSISDDELVGWDLKKDLVSVSPRCILVWAGVFASWAAGVSSGASFRESGSSGE